MRITNIIRGGGAILLCLASVVPVAAWKKGEFNPAAARLERSAEPAASQRVERIIVDPILPKGMRLNSAFRDATKLPPMAGALPTPTGNGPSYALGDGTEIYGSLIYSNLWSGTTGAYGIYKFPASTYTEPALVYNQQAYEANGGGCYANGKYYWNSFIYTDEMGFTFTTFCTYDFGTREFTKNILSFINDNFDLQQITNALTYDPTEGKIYALANIKVTDETGFIERYYPSLSEVDTYTGFATPIARIPAMIALASTSGGELFGITKGADASLYRINKKTGDCMLVGSTGISADFAQSMAFDPISCKLYWAAVQSNGRSGLYEVDTTTGRASLLFNFGNNEEFTGLYIPEPEVAGGAPAAVSEITASFADGSLSGKFTVKAPTTTHSGATLSGNISLTILTDGAAAETKTVAPGGSVTLDRTLTEGVHSLTAYASNSEGDGARKTLSKYIGIDAPGAVGNLKVQAIDGGKAHISWTAPTIGRHDGYIDPAQLTYKIVRQPDMTTVASGITATYFTDPVALPAGNFSYVVTAYCGNREGLESSTAPALLGQGSNLPCRFDFETKEAYDLFTVIDANGDWDGEYFWGGWMYSPDFKYSTEEDGKCALYGYHPEKAADDWLITPPVTVEKGKKYRLKFVLWTRGQGEKVEVTAGSANTVAAQKVILPVAEYSHKDHRTFTQDFTAEADGNYYVGFHITSPKKRYYCFIDDIEIDAVPDTDAPAAVGNLKATAAPGGDTKATITFTAPSKTLGGASLSKLDKVCIYHGNSETPIFTANPAPGASVSWTDENVAGWTEYRVVPYANGKAGEKSETKVFVGWDTPLEVSNLSVSDASGKPVITWSAPTAGVNGGYIDSSKLTYTVYRYEDELELIEKEVSGTTFTDNTLDGSRQQHLVSYLVAAKSPAGYGDPSATDYIVFGTPYAGEFIETFSDASVHSTPWVMYRIKGNVQNWGIVSYGTNPSCAAVGNDGGMASYGINGRVGDEGLLVTPKLDISGFSAPTLTFYFYHNYTDEHAAWGEGFEDRLIPEVMLPDGTRKELHAPIYVDDLGTGWLKYSCDLTAYKQQPYIRIAFRGITACEQDIYIDHIQVTNLISYDLQAYSFSGNGRVEAGKQATYKFTVFNRGAADADGSYKVHLLDGKNIVATLPGVAMKSKAYQTFTFTRSYDEAAAGSTHRLHALIEWDADEVADNNVSDEVTTEVTAPPMPEIHDLAAKVDDRNVALSWGKPDGRNVAEGFEDHLPFETTDFGGYTMHDGDGNKTWGFQDVYFDNTGEAQAFMVFNPVNLGIVTLANSLFPYDTFDPHAGNQVLACFQGYTLNSSGNAVSAKNDDWFISPEVFGGQTISLYAKAADYMQGTDMFEVMYSSTDNKPGSFKKLSEVITTTKTWEQHEFTLPEDAKYFAIHCVSEDAFILFIDDLTFVEKRTTSSAKLTGYKLYRDGVMLTELPASATSFADNSLADGNYVYHLIAVYDNGREAATGNKVMVAIGTGGIDGVGAEGSSVSVEDNTIIVEAAETSEVAIVASDGKIIFSGRVESLRKKVASGVYIVRVGNRTTKVII